MSADDVDGGGGGAGGRLRNSSFMSISFLMRLKSSLFSEARSRLWRTKE